MHLLVVLLINLFQVLLIRVHLAGRYNKSGMLTKLILQCKLELGKENENGSFIRQLNIYCWKQCWKWCGTTYVYIIYLFICWELTAWPAVLTFPGHYATFFSCLGQCHAKSLTICYVNEIMLYNICARCHKGFWEPLA